MFFSMCSSLDLEKNIRGMIGTKNVQYNIMKCTLNEGLLYLGCNFKSRGKRGFDVTEIIVRC